jgi:hypothetical protein
MALALARSMGRLESSVQGLRQRPRVKDSALITEMKKHAATTHRAYADNPIYAFHARVLVPPELAVVTLKRFWSGQITTEEIVDTCHRRQVEQLLLGSVSRQDAHWTNTLASVFTVAYQEEGLILYMLVNPATRR